MRKPKRIRWSVNQAALEIGRDRRTITSRLRRCGAEPGADGKFSPRQIFDAVFDEEYRQKVRLAKVSADNLELRNEERRSQLVDAEIFGQVMLEWFDVLEETIRGFKNLEPEDLRKMLAAVETARQSTAALTNRQRVRRQRAGGGRRRPSESQSGLEVRA